MHKGRVESKSKQGMVAHMARGEARRVQQVFREQVRQEAGRSGVQAVIGTLGYFCHKQASSIGSLLCWPSCLLYMDHITDQWD